MELQSISQVSRQFNISTRTLRYYEQMGLITPVKKDDYSYRTYDADTINRLQQIIILRKLRIPLKQISEILKSDSAATAITAFEQNLVEIENEITALSTIRSIIKSLLDKLNLDQSRFALPDDESLLEIVDSLTVTKINFKEEKNMEDLNQASKKLNKLTDRDVRIIYLPPSAVASCQYIGDNPEGHTGEIVDRFVKSTKLYERYPAMRHFGFNSPNPVDETGRHGYERWITVPDDMELPEPFVKKHFDGGLFAAHTIPMGAFEEWGWLLEWVCESKKYDLNIVDQGNGYHYGLFEEHLNYVNYVVDPKQKNGDEIQLDLLIAVRDKQ